VEVWELRTILTILKDQEKVFKSGGTQINKIGGCGIFYWRLQEAVVVMRAKLG